VLFAELYEVLTPRRFRKYINEQDVRVFLVARVRRAERIDRAVNIKQFRDPKDPKVLQWAIGGNAAHLVKEILALSRLIRFRACE
jgi:predicted nucleic acid-binding protein